MGSGAPRVPAQGRCGVAAGQPGEDGLFQAGTGAPATVALSAVSLVPPVRVVSFEEFDALLQARNSSGAAQFGRAILWRAFL